MKRSVLFAFLAARLAYGELEHNLPIPILFDQSDVVFAGRAASARPLQTNGAPTGGDFGTTDWTAAFAVEFIYKGQVPGRLADVTIPDVGPMSGPPVLPGAECLVFVKKEGEIFKLVDGQAILPFWGPLTAGRGSTSGLTQIEKDTTAVAVRGVGRARDAFDMLFRIPVLSEQSIEAIRSFDPKTWDDGAILRLEILARAGPPADFDALAARIADRDDGNSIPEIAALCDIVMSKTSSENMTALQRLSNSSIPGLRYSSMDAIRRIRDPKAIPFLLGKLRAADRIEAHQALIALMEITGRTDLGTDMGSFMADPERFVGPWERWWSESGAKPK